MADEPRPEVKVDAKGKSTVKVEHVDRQTPSPFGVGSVKADPFKKGLDTWLVALAIKQKFEDAHVEIRAAGCIATSSGGLRDLGAKVNSARSATSFHYTGRAIDLYIYSSMNDPDTDPYVVTADPDIGTWRIFARSSDQNLADTTITGLKKKFVKAKSPDITEPVTVSEVETTGKFVDLTALFLKHGFKRIPARDGFLNDPTQRQYGSAEWWHFQQEDDLVIGTTTFGSLLRLVYTEAQLKDTGPNNSSNAIWNGKIFK
jgi:hypothetical protein